MTPSVSKASKVSKEQYAPFMRHDRYGDMGIGAQPRLDVLCQSARALCFVPARLCCCAFWVVVMWMVGLICNTFPFLRSLLLAPGCRLAGRGCLLSLGLIRIEVESLEHPDATAPKLTRDQVPLVVANHSSYLDILLLSYMYAPAYVTREETRSTPFIGTICSALPCLFVRRVAATNDGAPPQSTSDLVVERVTAKHNAPDSSSRPLTVFPEGTTTNGSYLLPFRTGAFRAGVPVQPVLIRYNTASTLHPTWETITAARHIYLLLSDWWHTVRVVELPLYVPGAAEKSDAKLYAQNVRQYMADWSEKLGMPLKLSSSTYETKKLYHDLLREEHGMVPDKKKKA